MVENLRIGSTTKFADLQFADNQKKYADSHISEICGFVVAD
jgi:hypothetical protein